MLFQQLCKLVELFSSYSKGYDFKRHLAEFFFFNYILGEPRGESLLRVHLLASTTLNAAF